MGQRFNAKVSTHSTFSNKPDQGRSPSIPIGLSSSTLSTPSSLALKLSISICSESPIHLPNSLFNANRFRQLKLYLKLILKSGSNCNLEIYDFTSPNARQTNTTVERINRRPSTTFVTFNW